MGLPQTLLASTLILASWYSWGKILARAPFLAGLRLPWAAVAALGLSFELAVGGWLDFFGLIGSGALIALVAVPCLYPLALFWRTRGKIQFRRPSLCVGEIAALTFLVLLLLNQFFGAAASHVFTVHDDLHSYLALPIRALQTGTFEGDPFNVRRLESSLGGMSFLDAIHLALAPLGTLNALDLGVSAVACAAMIFAISLELGATRLVSLLMACLVTLVPLPWSNLTPLGTAEFLFLALLFLCVRPGESRAVARALVGAGLCVLKSTLIAPVGLVLLLTAIIERKQPRALRATGELVATGFLAMLPWMLSLHRSDGTFLYPLLGRGVHASAYGEWPAIWSLVPEAKRWEGSLWVMLDPMVSGALALMVWLAFFPAGSRTREDRRMMLFEGGVIAACLAISFETGWAAPHRYNFPFAFAGFAALAAAAFAKRASRARNVARTLIIVAFLGYQVGSIRGTELAYFRFWSGPSLGEGQVRMRPARQGRDWGYDLEAIRPHLLKVQESVPEGAAILERISLPVLFNFRRNPIYLADFPGIASPAPGMPLFRGPELLAEYLLGHGIRYVAYSYGDNANFTPELMRTLGGANSEWMSLQAKYAFDFQDKLATLMNTRARVYDDGFITVLDLATSKR